jgi:hypothetical protein
LARPKKKVVVNTSSEQVRELPKDRVWDMLDFAKNLASGMYPGVVSPDLLNRMMKDNSFMPKAVTEDSLNTALQNPKESENELRSYIEMMEIVSMPLKRLMSYMSDLAAFDLTYTVTAKDGTELEPKDYKKPAYKKDLKEYYSFIDRFEYKQAFRNITKDILRNELFVGCFRDVGDGIVIQQLPIDRCRISGKWAHGYLISFDMMYFMNSGVDIRMFPKFFSDKFNELFRNADGSLKYNPALPPELRGSSSYMYWVDCPPDVAWAFKLDMSLVTSIPYFAALMPDLVNQSVMRSLQKDTNMAAASKILVGAVPMLKESKTSVANMIAIDPKTLGLFMALMKSSLSSAIKVASAPLEDIKQISFDENNEMYDSYLRTSVAASGMNSALFYSSKLKANAIESQLSLESDTFVTLALYPQFEQFMNWFVNKNTSKHNFYTKFEGNQFYLNRKQRFDFAMGLANIGILLPQKIAASVNMKPNDMDRMMNEAKGVGFLDKLLQITPAAQMPGSAGAKGAGRPQKDDSELGDAGSQSRDTGSNIEKGGSV